MLGLCSAGDGTKGFLYPGQVLYLLSHTTSPSPSLPLPLDLVNYMCGQKLISAKSCMPSLVPLVATFLFSHVSVIRFQIKPCYVGERPPLVTWLKNVLWDAKVKSRQDWHRSYRHRTSCSVLLIWTLLTQFSFPWGSKTSKVPWSGLRLLSKLKSTPVLPAHKCCLWLLTQLSPYSNQSDKFVLPGLSVKTCR